MLLKGAKPVTAKSAPAGLAGAGRRPPRRRPKPRRSRCCGGSAGDGSRAAASGASRPPRRGRTTPAARKAKPRCSDPKAELAISAQPGEFRPDRRGDDPGLARARSSIVALALLAQHRLPLRSLGPARRRAAANPGRFRHRMAAEPASLYIARGNAVAARGTSEVRADTLIAHYRDAKTRQHECRAGELGNAGGNTEIYRVEAEGRVTLKRDAQHRDRRPRRIRCRSGDRGRDRQEPQADHRNRRRDGARQSRMVRPEADRGGARRRGCDPRRQDDQGRYPDRLHAEIGIAAGKTRRHRTRPAARRSRALPPPLPAAAHRRHAGRAPAGELEDQPGRRARPCRDHQLASTPAAAISASTTPRPASRR